MNSIHVLISLFPGYGLGDAVQMTAVLRHVRKNRPGWVIDYVADVGRHSAMIGLVRNALAYGDAPAASSYDREIDIKLYDTFAGWPDRPNTRVSACLHERFGMAWERELGAYQINVTEDAKARAFEFLSTLGLRYLSVKKTFPIVAIQYEGDSAKDLKNLTHEQAKEICQSVIRLGRVPLLMDWRNLSPLPDQKTIHTTGRLATSSQWGGDAQMNAAIISQSEAFVGIDSGPGKCAAATRTPTLICWTGNHPALYFDPCPNTTHLIPANWRQNPLLRGRDDVIRFFDENYDWRPYAKDSFYTNTLTHSVSVWLKEVLT